MRMVPDQDPHKVSAALRAYLDAQGFSDIEITPYGFERPGRVDPRHPFVQLVADTARDVYGRPALIEPLSAGTGPIYPFLKELGVPVATAGAGYPGNRVHAPDENLRLTDLVHGAQHTARIMARKMEW